MARLFCTGAIAWLAGPLCAFWRVLREPADSGKMAQVAARYSKDCKRLAGPAWLGAIASHKGAADSAWADYLVVTPYHYKASGSTGARHESLQVRITILPEVSPAHPLASSAGRRRRGARVLRSSAGQAARFRPPGPALHPRAKCTTL
jgi:hypothetical protein